MAFFLKKDYGMEHLSPGYGSCLSIEILHIMCEPHKQVKQDLLTVITCTLFMVKDRVYAAVFCFLHHVTYELINSLSN